MGRGWTTTGRGVVAALLLVLCWPALPLAAAEPAGKLLMARGQVTAVAPGGDIRSLQRGDVVYPGETLATGPNSSLRIRFSDGAFLFLRPGSRFRIDEYRDAGTPEQDKSVFSLLKGGFRSITGAIGHRDKENVKIGTPVATIGIRGTDHQGRYCQGDCIDLMNRGVQPPPDGLYTGTTSGATSVGGQVFRAGQFGYTDPQQQTVTLPTPPPILSVDNMPDPSAGGGNGGDQEEGDGAAGGGAASGEGGDGGDQGGGDGGGQSADDGSSSGASGGGDGGDGGSGGGEGGQQDGAGGEASGSASGGTAEGGGGDGSGAGDVGGGEGGGTELPAGGGEGSVGGGQAPEEFEIPSRTTTPVTTECIR
ncbi:FecR family protein [Endothiovibrio diazotrophicus]